MRFLLHHGFELSAAARPDAVAVVDGARSLTYGELEARANQLANTLRELGVGCGDRVGLYLAKSLDAVVGCYGVLKSGAAYVPLDPDAPVDRVAYIAADCGLRVLISSVAKGNGWETIGERAPELAHIVVLGEGHVPAPPAGIDLHDEAALDTRPGARPTIETIDEDLALILYTSGSTGDPKGVMLSHRNVMGFVDWAVEEFAVTESDRLSQLAPLHFDLSTFDIYGASLAGATLYVARKETFLFPLLVRKFFEGNEITVTYSVPSILTMLVERGELEVGWCPSLRTVLFAGEVFPTKYLSRSMKLLPGVEFANLFGPTETNVCTFYRVPEVPAEDDPPISIGGPITNVQSFVVGEEGELLEPGEAGELYIRGLTVMQGYWGDPERSARSLVPHPTNPDARDLCYRTGDLVIESENGDYTFLGRRDNQIKSRGYRIELGDIETAIYAHDDVVECAAIAIPDPLIGNRIKGFVVARNDLDQPALVQFIGAKIPDYMIPHELEFLDELPKTSTGKIDRQQLTQQTGVV